METIIYIHIYSRILWYIIVEIFRFRFGFSEAQGSEWNTLTA